MLTEARWNKIHQRLVRLMYKHYRSPMLRQEMDDALQEAALALHTATCDVRDDFCYAASVIVRYKYHCCNKSKREFPVNMQGPEILDAWATHARREGLTIDHMVVSPKDPCANQESRTIICDALEKAIAATVEHHPSYEYLFRPDNLPELEKIPWNDNSRPTRAEQNRTSRARLALKANYKSVLEHGLQETRNAGSAV